MATYEEQIFTPWTTIQPPYAGWYLCPVEAQRYWDGAAWSDPVHESARTEGENSIPIPPRDLLAVAGAVPWRVWSSAFFDEELLDGAGNCARGLVLAQVVEAMLANGAAR
ncbi:MAG: DUF2510 domain-containing protein [Burkholderiaceae bacterium]